MLYGEWPYYREYYGTITTEAEFNRMNGRASALLDAYTGNRAILATGFKAERLKDAACRMIELMKAGENAGAGTGVTSVSNDGYTETYAATTPEAVDRLLRQCAFCVLSGTGLMGAM